MKEEEKQAKATAATANESEMAAGEDGSSAEQPCEQAAVDPQAQKIADLERQILRVHADFDNYRKRTLRDREEQQTQAEITMLRAMLPVLDNFDRALSALPTEQSWAEGVRMVHRQWLDALTALGLTVIDCSQPFDPNLHEAVMRDDGGTAPDGTILQELQRGYQYKGRLVRPSMVKVAVGADS